jgi:hypothetical protein
MQDLPVQTIANVNKKWPLLRRIATDIMACWERIFNKKAHLTSLEKKLANANGVATNPEEIDKQIMEAQADINEEIERINGYIKEVEELGGYLEELKRGIVNFPALSTEVFPDNHSARRIMLCVCPTTEEAVGHFHELDETYTDRVKIAT